MKEGLGAKLRHFNLLSFCSEPRSQRSPKEASAVRRDGGGVLGEGRSGRGRGAPFAWLRPHLPALTGPRPTPGPEPRTPAPRSAAHTFLATHQGASVWTVSYQPSGPDPPSARNWENPGPELGGARQPPTANGPWNPTQMGHEVLLDPAQDVLGKRRFWKGPKRLHSCRWRLLWTRFPRRAGGRPPAGPS